MRNKEKIQTALYKSLRAQGEWVLWSVHNNSSLLPLPSLICCCCMDSPYLQLPSGISNFSRVGSSMYCSIDTCSTMITSKGKQTPLGILCFAPPLPLVCRRFLTHFFFPSLFSCSVFLPFLKLFLPQVAPPWLQGSAVSPAAPTASIWTSAPSSMAIALLSIVLSAEELRF